MGNQPAYALSSVQGAIQRLLDVIDADPEIEVCLCKSAIQMLRLPNIYRVFWDTRRAQRPLPRSFSRSAGSGNLRGDRGESRCARVSTKALWTR